MEPDRHKGKYGSKHMNLNFLADSDQQIQNALTEEKLAHHLSVELAQGNHLFPSSICSPAIPTKWSWHSSKNKFSKRTQGIASSESPNLVPCSFLNVGLIERQQNFLLGWGVGGEGNSSIDWANKEVTEVCERKYFPSNQIICRRDRRREKLVPASTRGSDTCQNTWETEGNLPGQTESCYSLRRLAAVGGWCYISWSSVSSRTLHSGL